MGIKEARVLSRIGWWATHDYKRRSVEQVESFVGWEYLEDLVRKCETPRDAALIAALFETGGRVSEVLQLSTNMIFDENGHIVIRAMPVVKRYEKIGKDEEGHWITKPKKGFRTFPIPKKEPLFPILNDWIQDTEGELFKIGRVRVYQIVRDLDRDIFPHWFRAQRASQLAVEYGFTIHDLVAFFNWRDLGTAVHYSRMGWKGLAEKMIR